ncbi:MAG: hypothetical protein JWQ79_2219 [Mucilaginibacter sp.]|nr:hypothetical protein [Mucilaginibacter sp.]
MKSIIPILLLSLISIVTNAQKLPNEQQTSVHAPDAIKVDGKATEWGDKFQAYNKATDLFYTLSNDDNKLYLTIQATDPAIIRRIISGGISLTINRSGQKNNKGAATITYPIFDPKNRFTAVFNRRGDQDSAPWYDSVMKVNNTRFADKAKMVRVTGIPNVDTLISVYNTDGIKTIASFNNKLAYTYELSVSLKQLGLSAGNSPKFAYQIKINEVEQQGITIIAKDGTTITGMTNIDPGQIQSISVTKGGQAGQFATYLWSEYTLAK